MQALGPNFYTDPDVFEQEQQAIFNKHWWLIGPADSINQTGDYIALTLGKNPIFVLHGSDGVLRGYHNVCRHRAGPMVSEGQGHIGGKLIVCQYHGWSYDHEGQLRNAHSLNDCIDRNQFSLYPVQVDCWNGLLFVCLNDQTPTLAEWLGDITDIASRFPAVSQMRAHGNLQKDSPINWKCYGDNACEGYHVSMVHQALGSTLNSEEVNIANYDNGKFTGFDVHYRGSADDPTRDGMGFWIYKYPGLLLHFAEYAFNAESVLPLAVDRIRVNRWFWIDDDAAVKRGVQPQQLIDSADQVIDEDLGICQKVNQNLRSGVYTAGVLSATDEPGTVYFQQLVRHSLGLETPEQ